MNVRVRVLDVTHVMPGQTANQQRDHATIKLSPFDTFILALPPVQFLFFYDDGSLPPFASVVSSLRTSLAATLAVFAPLAGKLTACPNDDVVIDCSPNAVRPGVKFVEAEYSGDSADMRRLARDAEHDTEAFLQLVSVLDLGRLPAPVLAVQVTRSTGEGGGTVVVGVSMHHAVADGLSVCISYGRETWARKFTRLSAPDLPTVNMLPEPDWTRQSRRTYLLSAGQIQALRRRILESQAAKNGDNQPSLEPPTTYVAIAALLWTSVASAVDRHADDADEMYFQFPADCRRRLRLDPGFFGNCIKVCYARATAGEICGNDGDHALASAAAAVHRAIREHMEEEDPLGDADRWVEINRGVPQERVAKHWSSHRFMAYEVDFGWGQPSRAEVVSVFSQEMATLVGARDGAVQVTVTLDRECINGFEAIFLSQVSACMIEHQMKSRM
ncbi:hypothetical protein ACQ4PT_039034 [Festuca glaucescens]